MAEQLSDVIIPEVYARYTAVNSPETSAFVKSGVVARNGALDAKANSGGKTLDIPYWKDLDSSTDPNLSDSDPTKTASAEAASAGEMIARCAYLNKGYTAADLVGEIAGSEPMQHIRNRFGTYWQRAFEKRIISACKGILAANKANNSSDMINSIVTTTTSVADANRPSYDAIVDTVATMGDAFGGIRAIAMHSSVYFSLLKQDTANGIKPSEGSLLMPTYRGLQVVIDDSLPTATNADDSSATDYTCILFGAGAIGWGVGTPSNPVAVQRSESEGNGGGVETLWERNTWLIHPMGFKVAADPAGMSFTNTELATAATWSRVLDRKNLPIAFLECNV